MEINGNDFHWVQLHIDSFLISDLGLYGTKEEWGKYMFLQMKYLKNECVLTYESGVRLISKETLDKFIDEYKCIYLWGNEAEREEKCIRISEADNNWDKFMKRRINSSKGGKTTQNKKKKKQEEKNSSERIMTDEEIQIEVNKNITDELPF